MDNKAFHNDEDAGKKMEIEEAQPSTSSPMKSEKFHIYKNVLLISVSFLALFIGFESMSKLQSSINSVSSVSGVSIFPSELLRWTISAPGPTLLSTPA